jgi:hypothetical protein
MVPTQDAVTDSDDPTVKLAFQDYTTTANTPISPGPSIAKHSIAARYATLLAAPAQILRVSRNRTTLPYLTPSRIVPGAARSSFAPYNTSRSWILTTMDINR